MAPSASSITSTPTTPMPTDGERKRTPET
jgi:hypothetical protein